MFPRQNSLQHHATHIRKNYSILRGLLQAKSSFGSFCCLVVSWYLHQAMTNGSNWSNHLTLSQVTMEYLAAFFARSIENLSSLVAWSQLRYSVCSRRTYFVLRLNSQLFKVHEAVEVNCLCLIFLSNRRCVYEIYSGRGFGNYDRKELSNSKSN